MRGDRKAAFVGFMGYSKGTYRSQHLPGSETSRLCFGEHGMDEIYPKMDFRILRYRTMVATIYIIHRYSTTSINQAFGIIRRMN
jgi:hypothetical protein